MKRLLGRLLNLVTPSVPPGLRGRVATQISVVSGVRGEAHPETAGSETNRPGGQVPESEPVGGSRSPAHPAASPARTDFRTLEQRRIDQARVDLLGFPRRAYREGASA